MGIDLFLHNQAAYKAAVEMMEQEGKAAVIHPTGTGKSMIAFKLAEERPDSRILWLSPSGYIYRTQLENLNRGLRGQKAVMENISFLTYSKLMITEREEIASFCPDYIVLDEFHRCGAREWGKGVKALLDAFPKAKLLGLSATNIRYLDSARDMAEELFDGKVASEMTLGEAIVRHILPEPLYVLSLYSWQEEFKKWSAKAASQKDKGLKEDNEKILQKLRHALERSEGLDQVFARHMKKRSGKYIAFCISKEHMEEMKGHAGEWFARVDKEPHVYSVCFDSPHAEEEFLAFKEDKSEHLKILFCIDLLNEGVHVEGVDGVILLRPTVSPTLYLQQVGRALSAGKSSRPVIFDIVNNFESLCSIDFLKKEIESAAFFHKRETESEPFSGGFQIVDEVKDCRALFLRLQKNLSAPWDIYYEAARDYYRENGNLKIPKTYVTKGGLSLGSWIQTQRRARAGRIGMRLSEEQAEKLSAIGMVWEFASDENWERGYRALAEYCRKYGNADVKADYVTEDGYRLGRWVSNLRQKGRREHPSEFLTEEQSGKLKAVGMIWDKNAYQWELNYNAAKEYYQAHGNLKVPAGYCSRDGMRLGNWVRNQRQAYAKKGGAAGLREDQVRRLSDIGMVFIKRG